MKRVDLMVTKFGLAALSVVLATGFGGLSGGSAFAETATPPVAATAISARERACDC